MLGLGGSIGSGDLQDLVIAFYSSNFSSGVDSWGHFSETGTPDLEYNQTGPDGENGWLKITYNDNQDAVGLERNFATHLGTTDRSSEQYYSGKFKIYIQDSGTLWGPHSAGDNSVVVKLQVGGIVEDFNVEKNTLTNLNIRSSDYQSAHNWLQKIRIVFLTADDLPEAGAIWWLKDVEVEVNDNKRTANIDWD